MKNILAFIPRTWRASRETQAIEATTITTRLENLAPSMDYLLKQGLPQDAALDVALQLSGVQNTESVLNRLSLADWHRMGTVLSESEAMLPALYATKTASTEPIRELLLRIIEGELENPGDAPRSVMELINKLGKKELEAFLRLRSVLWKEESLTPPSSSSAIFCLQEERSYPELLGGSELARLAEIGLIKFGPLPFESHFPGPIAAKLLEFGEKRIRVLSSKPDSTLYLGHYALTNDGRFIIDMYDESCDMDYGHFEAVCSEWRKQGFTISDYSSG